MKTSFALTGTLLAALTADAASLTRQELERKLEDLAKKPAPTKLAPGAMCYDTAAPLNRQEYACPTCGEKTLYSSSATAGWQTIWALEQVSTYRRLAKELKTKELDCDLDESAFCAKCGKDATNKVYVLVVRLPERKEPHRTALRDTDDLTLLLEFLTGKSKHDAGQGAEQPLKAYLPRIRELLGVEDKVNPTGKEK